MKATISILAAGLCLTAAVSAQTNYSVVTSSRFDATSLDDKGGELSKIRPFGLWQFTPSKTGTAAYHVLSSSNLSALMGDPDGDGKLAVFNGMKDAGTFAISPFIKDKDRKKNDPRLLFWTVKDYGKLNTTIHVFRNGKKHVVRPGDFVRINANGNAEFFITQDLIMKGVGAQKGAFIKGVTALCQSSTGALFFAPGHGRNAANTGSGGGFWIGSTFIYDGGVCTIPASAIKYDNAGNVVDVKGSSATLLFNEIGSGPLSQLSARDMIKNSNFRRTDGLNQNTSLWMTGVEIDPNGGTFKDWGGNVQPNLIFTFENYRIQLGTAWFPSWAGTIFSTRPTKGVTAMGSLAVINGVEMGVTTSKATGAWTGLKNSPKPPCLRGLALLQANHKPLAPSGPIGSTTINDGVVTMGVDPSIVLAFQDSNRVAPGLLMLAASAGKGQRSIGLDLGVILSGYADVHVLRFGPSINVAGVSDIKGRLTVTIPTPTNTALKGVTLNWQMLFVRGTTLNMTPPVLTEIR